MEYRDPPPRYEGPPSYESVVSQNVSTDDSPDFEKPTGLMVKDFSPESQNVTFQILVGRANEWLEANPCWEVKTCESYDCRTLKPNNSTFCEYPAGTRYMQRLRLWLTLRDNEQQSPQQISYLNVIPRQLSSVLPEGGETLPRNLFPRFERLDTFMAELNSSLLQNPVSGRIISINMRPVKINPERTVDPDELFYFDHGFSVICLRIFYEVGPTLNETVGVIDFFPKHLGLRGAIGISRYESVPTLVSSASSWYSLQENIRICSMQTVALELKPGLPNRVDSLEMDICDDRSQGQLIKYLRILRVCYVRTSIERLSMDNIQPSGPITCKTFLPVQLTSGMSEEAKFETVSLTLIRIADWVRKNNAEIVGAESFPAKMYILPEEHEGPDVTYFYKDAIPERFIWIFRLYLNGGYPDPPRCMCPTAYRGWWAHRVRDTTRELPSQPQSGDCCIS